LDIAELRLALITLATKPAHRHLSPADFDVAYGLSRQLTRSDSAKEHFEYNRGFWDIIFGKTASEALEIGSFREMNLVCVRCSKKVPLRFSKPVLDSFFSFLHLRHGYRESDARGRTLTHADWIRPSVDS
jgi:hypothetical protein